MNGTYVSLFSGIGGLDLAVEQFGYRCVAQVEWDAHATRVLERHWPDVPRWGDIHGFSGHGYVDLICGGFPCQPASTAGRRKGTEDDRWLWPEFARVVGELGPRFVVVENVPGLTTVNGGRALSEVLGTLADLGYDTRWASVRASDVGAPHRRQRIFLLAHTHDGGQPAQLRSPSLTGIREGQAGAEPARANRRVATDAESERHEREGQARGRGTGPADFSWGAYEPAIRRWETVMGCAPHPVDDKGRLDPAFVEWMQGFPAAWTEGMTRTQALKALGNAVVPQQAIAAIQHLGGGPTE